MNGRRRGWSAAEDGGLRAAVVLGGVCVFGLVLIGLAWRGVARELYVPLQTPFLVSAGIGGLAIVGAGAVLLAVHLERRDAAAQRARMEKAVSGFADLAGELSVTLAGRSERATPPARARRRR